MYEYNEIFISNLRFKMMKKNVLYLINNKYLNLSSVQLRIDNSFGREISKRKKRR